MNNPKTTFIMGILTAFAAVVFYMENMYEVPIKTVVRKIDNLVEIEKPKPNFSDDAEQINSSLNKSKLKHVLIYIHALCDEYTVPYDLAKSVIMTESSWDHKAVSTSGAIGLMQIKPETAYSEFKTPKEDLYDPYVNVTVGIMYLSDLYHNSGDDWYYALTGYSHGPTATKKYSYAYISDNFYVNRVFKYFNK
tara:strand:- start:1053 stop:1631 length:579 start_codon:yes stop_codon:yes gene_type:complete